MLGQTRLRGCGVMEAEKVCFCAVQSWQVARARASGGLIIICAQQEGGFCWRSSFPDRIQSTDAERSKDGKGRRQRHKTTDHFTVFYRSLTNMLQTQIKDTFSSKVGSFIYIFIDHINLTNKMRDKAGFRCFNIKNNKQPKKQHEGVVAQMSENVFVN